MNLASFYGVVFLAAMVGILFGIILACYEDGKPFGMYRRLRCKYGKHRMAVKVGKLRISKYFCQDCKIPRKHPNLMVIKGGTRLSDTKFDL